MPVGLVAEAEFPLEATELRPGDKLIAYSDGVTEAQNPHGEFFGRKRLREIAVENARGSYREAHDAILAALAEFTEQAEQADDMTLCVMEFGGST
jgi:serine phosphatase RsbU (regulator of sigma subunit)